MVVGICRNALSGGVVCGTRDSVGQWDRREYLHKRTECSSAARLADTFVLCVRACVRPIKVAMLVHVASVMAPVVSSICNATPLGYYKYIVS